jgi:hypothetical protein
VDRLTDRTLRLVARSGKLVNQDAENFEIRAISPNVFRVPGEAELTFSGAAPARVAKLVRPGADTAVFAEAHAVSLTGTRLSEYAGTYASEELEVQLVVAVKGDSLVLQRRPADEMTMRPIYEDDFGTPIGSLRFSRDANGRITGFGVFNGRIRDVRFSKN